MLSIFVSIFEILLLAYVIGTGITIILGMIFGLSVFVLRFLFKYLTIGMGVVIILVWMVLILL